ncbi:LysE family translocator [Marinobacter zhejiangensis]|uniref:Resistance to homoserine/threonine (RhtB) family protein n=1 Tax=Marinobacter zhejiangensis TaxID=488535 RepID=A0A1I4NG86_9GAMM|nr:LysE family translocator [Marinobacter zhejiangensis]SFM14290.1 resistance to homoserine/threonine (RhtB) family protein [Marinobacter zhejiangensis]
MPSIELLGAYLVAIFLLTISPGVDTLLTIRNTARSGVRSGVVTSVGICSGLFIHAGLSAVGISLILVQTAWAFSVLKWAGACYLVWLGLNSLRQACVRPAVGVASQPPQPQHSRFARDFREGVLSNVLNPKTALFYMALLPQFIDPQGSVLLQSMLLAAIHFVMGLVWLSGVAVVVARSRGLASPGWLKRMMHGLTGGVFIGVGAKVALSQA